MSNVSNEQQKIEGLIGNARSQELVLVKQNAVNELLRVVETSVPDLQIYAFKILPEFYPICTTNQQLDIQSAIYDLCEDESEAVRIAGYNSILELSKGFPDFQLKNADVLCQLLQCGECLLLIIIPRMFLAQFLV